MSANGETAVFVRAHSEADVELAAGTIRQYAPIRIEVGWVEEGAARAHRAAVAPATRSRPARRRVAVLLNRSKSAVNIITLVPTRRNRTENAMRLWQF